MEATCNVMCAFSGWFKVNLSFFQFMKVNLCLTVNDPLTLKKSLTNWNYSVAQIFDKLVKAYVEKETLQKKAL